MSQCDVLSSIMTCNDNGGGCSLSASRTAPVALTAGQTYYIALGSTSSSTNTGSGTITVTQTTVGVWTLVA